MANGDKKIYLVSEPGVVPNHDILEPINNTHVIKATSAKSAAVAYAIKLWALYRKLEDAPDSFDVYNTKGELIDQIMIPEWIDDQFCQDLKAALMIEVRVEINPVGYGETDLEAIKAAAKSPLGGLTSPQAQQSVQAQLAAAVGAAQAGTGCCGGGCNCGGDGEDEDEDGDDDDKEYEAGELEFAVVDDPNDPIGNGNTIVVYIHPLGHFDAEGCLSDQDVSFSAQLQSALAPHAVAGEMESTYSSNFKTAAQAIAALSSIGLVHHQGLQDFLERGDD